ncbi:RsiV family protein [Mycobacterium sp. SM3041]|uniref:RsiV family protein n=1 Tax=Mycobacterium sp. SM3041 TaxID=3114291 RepID=UPI0032049E63
MAAISSVRGAETVLSVKYPNDLLNAPTTGAPMLAYLHGLANRWQQSGAEMVRDSDYHLDYQTFSHGTLRSIVFQEFWQTVGNPPNDAYRTFTFDEAHGRMLSLADLLKPGADPKTTLPPLVRPYLTDALNQAAPPHEPGTYPFTTDKFEPQPDGSGYAGDYRAFALTPDELILYLPDAPMAHENPWPRDRFVWSMDGGAVQVHVPLSALTPVLAV